MCVCQRQKINWKQRRTNADVEANIESYRRANKWLKKVQTKRENRTVKALTSVNSPPPNVSHRHVCWNQEDRDGQTGKQKRAGSQVRGLTADFEYNSHKVWGGTHLKKISKSEQQRQLCNCTASLHQTRYKPTYFHITQVIFTDITAETISRVID